MILPKRLSDPLEPARSYVPRRAGVSDVQRMQRQDRDLQRQPRSEPGQSLRTIGITPPDPEALTPDQMYRIQGGPGVADRLVTRLKNVSDVTVVAGVVTTVDTDLTDILDRLDAVEALVATAQADATAALAAAATAQATADGAVAGVGIDGGDSASSTGAWLGIYQAQDHIQDVYNLLDARITALGG